MNKSEITFGEFRETVLRDYRICYISRVVSLLGRKEVLTGKAKNGIFGGGKELPQLALSHSMQKGDYYAGYYRDQTLMLALGTHTVADIFSQIYGQTDPQFEKSSSGRQMSCHFATDFRNTDGAGEQNERYNIASMLSVLASQIPKTIGLGLASKLYRYDPKLVDLCKYSTGTEAIFASIGNAACSEGIFWECLNAIAQAQVPVVISIWDDAYGVSVPAEIHYADADLFKLLTGFQRTNETNGIELFQVRGWDYLELMDTYHKAARLARTEQVPCVVHVSELTQPHGHSTSGAHERYKSRERLEWESDYDCLHFFRKWIVESFIATEEDLDSLEKLVNLEVRTQAKESYALFLNSNEQIRKEAIALLDPFVNIEAIRNIRDSLVKNPDSLKSEIYDILTKGISCFGVGEKDVSRALIDWLNKKHETLFTTYGSNLLSSTSYELSAEPAIYKESSKIVDGREVLNACWDANLERDPKLMIFGEDVGFIGGVNQTFAGLQQKYGIQRVSDTGVRERALIGQAVGLAMRGFRPVVEIVYIDYILSALQLIADDLATLRWRTNGRQTAPVIISTRGHRFEGIWHAGSPMSALLSQLRGMDILVPRNCTQASGFYNYVLRTPDANPCVLVEPLRLYRCKEMIPENVGDFRIKPGIAEIIQAGSDLTLVTYGYCCTIATETAKLLKQQGIDMEIVDIQSLLPFDVTNVIIDSIKKTEHLVLLDEDVPGGATAYMYRCILEERSGAAWLAAPPLTITANEHRTPYGADGEYAAKPTVAKLYLQLKAFCEKHRLFDKKDKISQIIERTRRSEISTLNLSGLALTSVPKEVFLMNDLTELDLSNNLITELPSAISQLNQLRSLNLSHNQLQRISDHIENLELLECLDLSHNALSKLPDALWQMSTLVRLYLQQNLLQQLNLEACDLPLLEHLEINGNPITILPNELCRLTSLRDFYFTPEFITNVPQEVLQRQLSSILSFLSNDQPISVIKECKLVLCGQADVGKSSLLMRLKEDRFTGRNERTEGIGIHSWSLRKHRKPTINMRIWDLGGQESYHPTHKFFLTKNSVYLVVWDANIGHISSRLNYWLYIVHLISPSSPVIVVQNKIDEQICPIEQVSLKRCFPNIVGFANISCRTGRGRVDLINLLYETAEHLPEINRPWLANWLVVRNRLSNLNTPYIGLFSYLSICQEEGIDAENATQLLKLLNEIGEVIHYSDDVFLNIYIFLDSQWLTKAVYQVIDSTYLYELHGKVSQRALKDIWKNDVSEEAQQIFVQIMKRFDLLFEITYNQFVIPIFLPFSQLNYTDDNARLKRRFIFDSLPVDIFTSMIVSMHDLLKRDNTQLACWKNAFIVQQNDAEGIIHCQEDDRMIIVTLTGTQADYLLIEIQRHLTQVMKRYGGLAVKELVPCVCQAECPHFYAKSFLIKELYRGLLVRCSATEKEVEIRSMISELELFELNKSNRRKSVKGVKIFISYAHEDEEFKEGIERHLSGLKESGLIHTWHDRQIKPGELWDEEIKGNLEDCKIILMLVSSYFMQSNYIQDVEIKRALDRSDRNELTIIPIIVRPCDFSSLYISRFHSLPKNTNPIVKWTDREEAYLDVIESLKVLLNIMKPSD